MISNFGGKFWNPNSKIRGDYEWGNGKKLPNDGLALKRPEKPTLPNLNEIDKGKIDKGIKDTFDNFG